MLQSILAFAPLASTGIGGLMPDRSFELRSEEVQDILSYIPHWVIRQGITVIFITLLMLIVTAWIIKYPDLVSARIVVTTRQPPVGVVAKSSGVLKLFVKENDRVIAGSYLASLANKDRIQDIFLFKQQLEAFRSMIEPVVGNNLMADTLPIPLNLQVDYTSFLQSYFRDRYVNQANYQADRFKTVLVQILYYEDLIRQLVRQKKLLIQEAALSEKKYHNDLQMYEKKLIAEEEFNKSQTIWLQKKSAIEQAGAQILDYKIKLVDNQKIALDFINQLAIWEEQYILKAPIDGTISFFKYWSDNQYVSAGDEVMAVVSDCREIVGKIYMPQASAGKVKLGQTVKIRFESYPYTEYGLVEGRVSALSPLAHESKYTVDVALPKGLVTSYGKSLEFKQGMQGTADIITEDLRLLQRVFYQFKYLFVNYVK